MTRARLFVLVAATLATGCDSFAPSFDTLRCGPGDTCPAGFGCLNGTCELPICGDGLILATEVCDDGNQVNGDGCDTTCATATCFAPVTHPNVAAGLADAACPTLYVYSGTYTENVTISRDVTVVAVGAEPVVLDGGAAGTVVTVAENVTATLRGFTIRNGQAEAGGGIVNLGTLTLDTMTVGDNVAVAESPVGGGIDNAGMLTLTSSVVTHNRLTSTATPNTFSPVLSGSGIHSSAGTVRLEKQSRIEANEITVAGLPRAGARGGGIAAANTIVQVTDASLIRDNVLDIDGNPGEASAVGAGLSVSGGTLTLSAGSAVDGNIAMAKGGGDLFEGVGASCGGLCANSTEVTMEASFVRNNQVIAMNEQGRASASGAGLSVSGGALMLRAGSAVDGNIATAKGGGDLFDGAGASCGGLCANSTQIAMNASFVRNNQVIAMNEQGRASASSAGVSVIGGTLTLSGGTAVDGNIAMAKGAVRFMGANASCGGLCASSTQITMNTVFVRNNQAIAMATGGGGASASAGGGSFFGGSLVITGSLVTGNIAHAENSNSMGSGDVSASVAGLRLNGLSATISDSQLSSNAVSAHGELMTFVSASVGALEITTSNTSQIVTLQRCTIDGNEVSADSVDDSRIFGTNALTGALSASSSFGNGSILSVNVVQTTISNNFVRGSFAANGAASVSANFGDSTVSLNFVNSTVSGNHADAPGGNATTGAIAAAAGFDNSTVNLNFVNSTVSSNRADASGGTITGTTQARATTGAIDARANFGNSTVNLNFLNSTVSGNFAEAPGGSAATGAIAGAASFDNSTINLNVMNSTVSGNHADASGGTATTGAIAGAASFGNSTVNLNFVNSTVSGNHADASGGTAITGAIAGSAVFESAKVNVNVASTTITNNSTSGMTALYGGLNLTTASSTASTATFKNSIVAGNTASTDPDCRSLGVPIISGGYNLIGISGSCTVSGNLTGNLSGDPGLQPLAANGGPTLTHAAMASSQVINAGDPTACTDLSGKKLNTDQRGFSRVLGGRCDIGAVDR